jgi:hypothetical protein
VTIFRSPGFWVFIILLGTYSYFWQSRDWNTASRLMLTYAMSERGSVSIDGYEDQTRDRARVGAHYYSDKLPGVSILAIPPSLAAKWALRLPDHPRHKAGFTHWPADYWACLGTAGLATALTGALLASLAARLGCGGRRAGLVGLAYGLSTPAFAYATMPYGHQVSAACLLASFALLWERPNGSSKVLAPACAGFLAAAAAAVELQVAPLSLILGFYAFIAVVRRRLPKAALATFIAAGMLPVLGILIYNSAAFGSPWEMGYFHEDLQQFQLVHNAQNRLGLTLPEWSRVGALLWGSYRGLFYYAPILILAPPGWIVLAVRRRWDVLGVSSATCLAMFLVNLSYPEWTGGWSTGPRLLVPLIPFAMLPVAALLAVNSRALIGLACALTLWGGIVIFLFVGVGARLRNLIADPANPTLGIPLSDPLGAAVVPLWRGEAPPDWWLGERFARNVASVALPQWVAGLPPTRQWLQFVPLLLLQALGVAGFLWMCGPGYRKTT